jgi:hypothetical protein
VIVHVLIKFLFNFKNRNHTSCLVSRIGQYFRLRIGVCIGRNLRNDGLRKEVSNPEHEAIAQSLLLLFLKKETHQNFNCDSLCV